MSGPPMRRLPRHHRDPVDRARSKARRCYRARHPSRIHLRLISQGERAQETVLCIRKQGVPLGAAREQAASLCQECAHVLESGFVQRAEPCMKPARLLQELFALTDFPGNICVARAPHDPGKVLPVRQFDPNARFQKTGIQITCWKIKFRQFLKPFLSPLELPNIARPASRKRPGSREGHLLSQADRLLERDPYDLESLGRPSLHD